MGYRLRLCVCVCVCVCARVGGSTFGSTIGDFRMNSGYRGLWSPWSADAEAEADADADADAPWRLEAAVASTPSPGPPGLVLTIGEGGIECGTGPRASGRDLSS